MKLELAHPIAIRGSMARERHVQADAIDWARRVVWLPDGRWVPFENIVVGQAEERVSESAPLGPAIAKASETPVPAKEAHVCQCKRVFPSAQALGGHQRFCKGATP